jgi:PRTRC genetic system protein D
MKVERIDLLVVGLSVASFKAKKRAALERLVLGRHDVGRGTTVQVERSRVVPQPQGALMMYYGHVHNRVAEVRKERSLIIDRGARTFDWLVTQGMQLVEKKSHSVNRPVRAFAERKNLKVPSAPSSSPGLHLREPARVCKQPDGPSRRTTSDDRARNSAMPEASARPT